MLILPGNILKKHSTSISTLLQLADFTVTTTMKKCNKRVYIDSMKHFMRRHVFPLDRKIRGSSLIIIIYSLNLR